VAGRYPFQSKFAKVNGWRMHYGRSGRPFPSGVEIAALVPGLEPMDTDQTDQDLWAILEWLVAGVGKPWSVEALRTTGRIFRVIPEDS
jgi:hypothetical protein